MEEKNATPPFIELRDAVVQRAGAPILTVDSFRLDEGEHIALLGPNGSGKSTFVKLITREVFPLHRDVPPVLFRGRERATLADVKRSLGIVSSTMQDQITVHLPAIDVVAGGLFGALGIPQHVEGADDARVRAHDAMKMLGVDNLAQRDIMTLSTARRAACSSPARSCQTPTRSSSTSPARASIPKACTTCARACARSRAPARASCS